MVNINDKINGSSGKDFSYRETDKNEINFENMKFLSPEKSADLFKVMSKINQQHTQINALSKSELVILFYGHIFTCSVDAEGEKRIGEEEMINYSEMMADCYHEKFTDVEMYIHQHMKDLSEYDRHDFRVKVEKYRNTLDKFEKILGRRDKI